jgi:hypothetical protein
MYVKLINKLTINYLPKLGSYNNNYYYYKNVSNIVLN